VLYPLPSQDKNTLYRSGLSEIVPLFSFAFSCWFGNIICDACARFNVLWLINHLRQCFFVAHQLAKIQGVLIPCTFPCPSTAPPFPSENEGVAVVSFFIWILLYFLCYLLNQMNNVNRLFVVCHFVIMFFKCSSTSHQYAVFSSTSEPSCPQIV